MCGKAPKGARQDPNEIDVFERETTLSYGATADTYRTASLGLRRSALAAQFAEFLRRADALGFGQRPSVTDLERTLDEYRRYQYLRATLEELRSEGDPLLRQFENMNRTLEQQIRDLLRRDLQKRSG